MVKVLKIGDKNTQADYDQVVAESGNTGSSGGRLLNNTPKN